MKILYVYNKYHLGDNIFNILFFNKILKYLEKNAIFINYYLKKEYIKEVNNFLIKSNNIKLIDYDANKILPNMYHLWIEDSLYKMKYSNSVEKSLPYNMFLTYFFNETLSKWNMPIKIKTIIYDDVKLLELNQNITNKNNYYKNIDILFINSIPFSGQFIYNNDEWIEFMNQFSQYNIITTNKIPHVKCTTDDNLSVKDIAAISMNAKVIICVNSGVVPGILNVYTMSKVKSIHCLDIKTYYNFPLYPIFKGYKTLSEINIGDIFKDIN